MKNIIILIFLTLTLSGFSDDKKVKNSLTEANLKGKVSSIEESQFDAIVKFGEVEKGRFISKNIIKYNPNGYIVERIVYETEEKVSSKKFYKYDEVGKKLEINSYNSEEKLISKTKFKYDNLGNEIENAIYNSDGSLDVKYLFNYDKNGNMIEIFKIYQGKALNAKILYLFNENNELIEEGYYDANNSLVKKVTYRYDLKGNRIEENTFDKNGAPFTSVSFKYDNSNRMVEKVLTELGTSYPPDIFEYDANDNIIAVKDLRRDGEVGLTRTFQYKYDNMINWVKKIYFFDSEVQELIGRKIEYYP